MSLIAWQSCTYLTLYTSLCASSLQHPICVCSLKHPQLLCFVLHHHNTQNCHHWTDVLLGTTALKRAPTHHSHCWHEGGAGRATLWLEPAASHLYWTLPGLRSLSSDWLLQRCSASLSALPQCGKYRIYGSCHLSQLLITSILTGSVHLGVITQRGNDKQNWSNHPRIIQKIITHSREHSGGKKKPKQTKKPFPFFFPSLFPSIFFLLEQYFSFAVEFWTQKQ